jgi:hypothetical protein
MKKKVNRYTQQIEVQTQNRLNVLMDFSRLLDCQVILAMHEWYSEPVQKEAQKTI